MSDLFGNHIVGFPTRRLNVKITMLDGIDDVTQNQNGVKMVQSNVMLIRPQKENYPSLWDWPSL